MFGEAIPAFHELIDMATVHVVIPATPTIFLCGGDISDPSKVTSLRGAFLRFAFDKPFDRYHVLLAEDLNAFFPRGTYKDLLSLESDLAQIASLIVVFSESYGSAAELGAFAMKEEIAKRLLVFIDDKDYSNNSFIKLGPLLSLLNNIGRSSVYVLDLSDLNMKSLLCISSLNFAQFKVAVLEGLTEREKSIEKRSTFSPSNRGHLIMLMTGLVQLHGALTENELRQCLISVGVQLDPETIINLMLCAEFVRWVEIVPKGSFDYYVSKRSGQMINFGDHRGQRA